MFDQPVVSLHSNVWLMMIQKSLLTLMIYAKIHWLRSLPLYQLSELEVCSISQEDSLMMIGIGQAKAGQMLSSSFCHFAVTNYSSQTKMKMSTAKMMSPHQSLMKRMALEALVVNH